MKDILKSIAVFMCCITTMGLTSAGIACLEHYTGYNLLSINHMPIGSMFAGILASSGFAFGYYHFGKLPPLTALLMASSFVLYLYIKYMLSNMYHIFSFIDYVSFISYYHRSRDQITGTNFGYISQCINFITFVVVGWMLSESAKYMLHCEKCNTCMRKLSCKTILISSRVQLNKYLADTIKNGSSGASFRETMLGSAILGNDPPAYKIVLTLRGCRTCDSQAIEQDLQVLEKGMWKKAKGIRHILPVQKGCDLRPWFDAHT